MIWVYALAALAALALAVVGVNGLMGFEPDPFASIFAILLAMPWFFLFDSSADAHPEIGAYGLILAGFGLNFAILFGLRAWLRRGLRVDRDDAR
ncbi:MAG: hypothetical protein Q8K28_20085 [Hoeflea sp.]|uniref:hypothetical protein n=1 Tax=Hoeflea sp. TaxID=1940281 RepID=UPI002732214F|nr:hypothetical protein [Hoeflea sp.]MDP2122206.1 hypothetical protein [Hoeflea sp.]